MDVTLYVRDFATDGVVSKVRVTNASERQVARVERGMLINMNREDYYVDSDEADAALELKGEIDGK